MFWAFFAVFALVKERYMPFASAYWLTTAKENKCAQMQVGVNAYLHLNLTPHFY